MPSVIQTATDLLRRQLDTTEVRNFLASLGQVEESSPDEEQGPEHYIAVRTAGLELMAEEGLVQAVTFYQRGHEGYEQYTGALPLGLSMALPRSEVRRLLGVPDFEMEAQDLPHLGRVGPCDRYDGQQFSTAIDYDETTGTIVKVQVMLPEAVPR